MCRYYALLNVFLKFRKIYLQLLLLLFIYLRFNVIVVDVFGSKFPF